MLILFVLIFILVILYVLSTMCATSRCGDRTVKKAIYAHRGLHGDGIPENSLAAFQRAKEAGYGMELDVHLLADGELAVIHDSALHRVTGKQGYIEDLKTADLSEYRLQGTEQTIPGFSEVLKLVDGKVPLVVELKCVNNNYSELCRKACEMLDGYNGSYCVESFDPRCVYWLRKHRPDIIRGQLTENYFVIPDCKLPWCVKFVMRHQMLNFLTQPDFIAYHFSDRKTVSNWICKHLWNAQFVTWTLKTKQDYDAAVAEGWLPIFEGFEP